MDESTKAKIAGLLEQAEQEAEQRGYTAGLAAGTEAAKRVTPYEEPGGPYEDNGMEARQVRHRLLWAATGEVSARIAGLEAEVARLQAQVPAVHTGPSIEEMERQRRERAEIIAVEKKPRKGGAK